MATCAACGRESPFGQQLCAGCVGTGRTVGPANNVEESSASTSPVTFVRLRRFAGFPFRMHIALDGKPLLSLANGERRVVQLPDGEHTLSLSAFSVRDLVKIATIDALWTTQVEVAMENPGISMEISQHPVPAPSAPVQPNAEPNQTGLMWAVLGIIPLFIVFVIAIAKQPLRDSSQRIVQPAVAECDQSSAAARARKNANAAGDIVELDLLRASGREWVFVATINQRLSSYVPGTLFQHQYLITVACDAQGPQVVGAEMIHQ